MLLKGIADDVVTNEEDFRQFFPSEMKSIIHKGNEEVQISDSFF